MMETNDCGTSLTFELNSNWTHGQIDVVEFGVTSVKITVNLNDDLKNPKSDQKAQEQTSALSQSSKNEFSCNVENSMAHIAITRAKQLFIEVLKRITIQRIVLLVILCVVTIGISVPVSLFVVKTFLKEDNVSPVELQIHQNYCKIHESSTV